MNGFTLLLIASTFGVDYGWQPSTDGHLEYIVQIEPVTLIALREGQEIVSQIDPYIQNVRRFRIRMGTALVPRRGEPPRQPPQTLPAASIESQLPGVSFGWQPLEDKRFELIVQIAPEKLATIRNGDEIAGEIPAEVPVLGRLQIRSGADQLPRLGGLPASAKAAGPTLAVAAGADPPPAWPLGEVAQAGSPTAPQAGTNTSAQAAPQSVAPVDTTNRQAVDSSSARQTRQPLQPPYPRVGQTAQQPGTGRAGPVAAPYQSPAKADGSSSVYGGGGYTSSVGTSQGQAGVGVAPGSQPYTGQSPNAAPANTWIPQDTTEPVPARPGGYVNAPDAGASQLVAGPANSSGWTGTAPPNYPSTAQAPSASSPYPPQTPHPTQGYQGQGYQTQANPAQGYQGQGYQGQGYQGQGYPTQANATQGYPGQGQAVPPYPASSAPGGTMQSPYAATLGGQGGGTLNGGQGDNGASLRGDLGITPWEDPAEKTFLVAYMDQKAKQETTTTSQDFWASLAEISNDRSLYYLADGNGGAYNGDKPWWPLTMAMLALFASMGGNLYIGWIAVGIYRRYLDVVIDDAADDRYERYRDHEDDDRDLRSRDSDDRYERSRSRSRDDDRSRRREHAADDG